MRLPQVKTDVFVPAGGQDVVSPPLALKNGVAIDARNYECDLEAGYTGTQGYDKFIDGKTASEYGYQLCVLSAISGTVQGGRTLRGLTSNATMVFMTRYDDVDENHLLIGGETGVGAYVAEVSGRFVEGELLEPVDGNPASVVMVSLPEPLTGATARDVALERARAERLTRRYMDKPGTGEYSFATAIVRVSAGPILGVVTVEGVPYVFRAVNPLRSDYAALFSILILKPFDIPSTPENRAWRVIAGFTRTVEGANFEFDVSNFENPAGGQRIYGVCGTGKAFVFDPVTALVTDITTGMAVDHPQHLRVHANRLWMSFAGSVQFSALNNSATWSPVVGAGELALGSDITGMLSLTGQSEATALMLSTKDRIAVMYGDSAANFQLVPFSENTGALEGTIQWMGQPIFQNAFGLTRLSASQNFGGFEESVFSGALKPFIDSRRGRAVASMVCRSKNQYRIFFDDKTAVYVTFKDGNVLGMFEQKLKHQVTCAWSEVLPNGTELLLIGTEDGGLYRMDVGTSFAGESIPRHIRLAFNHFRSPRLAKHFVRTHLEMQASGFAQIEAGFDLDYGGKGRAVTEYQGIETPDFGSGGYWDQGVWDEGYWDGSTRNPFTLDTRGNGTNMSIRLRGDDAISSPVTLSAVMIDYIDRRMSR